MYEKQKLEEAEYFLSRMKVEIGNPKSFQFELSAFLSASRSVLQFALKEVENTPNQAWYDGIVSKSTVLGFFKDKRDVNIHVQPVPLQIGVTATDNATIGIMESVVVVKKKEGRVVETITSRPTEQPSTDESPLSTVTHRYSFPDWTGSEDVLVLSEKYLEELRILVDDGIRQGYIQG